MEKLVKRLRWLMVCVILVDTAVTLMGQPGSYWREPGTAFEHNRLMHYFVVQGYGWLILWSLLYVAGVFAAVTFLPRRVGLVAVFSMIFGHYFGASTWLVYSRGHGVQGAVVYGILLATAIVFLGFPVGKEAVAEVAVRKAGE